MSSHFMVYTERELGTVTSDGSTDKIDGLDYIKSSMMMNSTFFIEYLSS